MPLAVGLFCNRHVFYSAARAIETLTALQYCFKLRCWCENGIIKGVVFVSCTIIFFFGYFIRLHRNIIDLCLRHKPTTFLQYTVKCKCLVVMLYANSREIILMNMFNWCCQTKSHANWHNWCSRNFYPRPVLAFGYRHRPYLCICQCVCVSITCLSAR